MKTLNLFRAKLSLYAVSGLPQIFATKQSTGWEVASAFLLSFSLSLSLSLSLSQSLCVSLYLSVYVGIPQGYSTMCMCAEVAVVCCWKFMECDCCCVCMCVCMNIQLVSYACPLWPGGAIYVRAVEDMTCKMIWWVSSLTYYTCQSSCALIMQSHE